MEALVAVGLASNVVQFAMCLATLAEATKQLYQEGTTPDLPAIKKATNMAIRQSSGLKDRLEASVAPLAEEDQVCIAINVRLDER
jgi:hypothetical protein